MFEIDAPVDESHPELGPQAERAARYITRGAEEMAAAGVIDVDPKLFGWSMWAAIHGIVMLHQSGMLTHGPDYKTLSYFHGLTMLKGAGAKFGQGGEGEGEEAMTAGVSRRASASEAGPTSRPMPRAPPAVLRRWASARTTASR